MQPSTIGDASQQFKLSRQNTAIKSDLGRLSSELSSGFLSDPTKALRGDTTHLNGIKHSLRILETFQSTTREVGQIFAATERALGRFEQGRSTVASDLLLVSDQSTAQQASQAARTAEATFADLVGALNLRHGDRSLFSGTATDQPALADPDDILAAVTTAVGPLTNASDIIAAVTAWFDTPGGGFETAGYSGGTGPSPQYPIGENIAVQTNVRADNTAFRDVLKNTAIAAMANRLPGLDHTNRVGLLNHAGLGVFAAAGEITELRGQIGTAQARVEEAAVEHTAHETALNTALSEMIVADPFETATRLQALQLQLETHYTLTSRLSRLSLVGYL